MLTKKKGDKVPQEDIKGNSLRDMTVESWLKNRELWNNYRMIEVMATDFIVNEEDGSLYVKKTASASAIGWVGRSIRLFRIHDGWLRAEYPDGHRFKIGDVDKNYRIVNLLYKITKVDNTVPERWWNTD